MYKCDILYYFYNGNFFHQTVKIKNLSQGKKIAEVTLALNHGGSAEVVFDNVIVYVEG